MDWIETYLILLILLRRRELTKLVLREDCASSSMGVIKGCNTLSGV
jgi:hypothetical protein